MIETNNFKEYLQNISKTFKCDSSDGIYYINLICEIQKYILDLQKENEELSRLYKIECDYNKKLEEMFNIICDNNDKLDVILNQKTKGCDGV